MLRKFKGKSHDEENCSLFVRPSGLRELAIEVFQEIKHLQHGPEVVSIIEKALILAQNEGFDCGTTVGQASDPEPPTHCFVCEHDLCQCPKPVPVVIKCPECWTQHIDEGEWATTRLHKTHECQECLHQWRPFDYHTVGVPGENPQ